MHAQTCFLKYKWDKKNLFFCTLLFFQLKNILWESIREVSQKTENKIVKIQQVHFWRYSQRKWHTKLKRYMYPDVHTAIYNSQDKDTTQGSINRWMDKKDVVYPMEYICNGLLLSHKKNEIMPFAGTWPDLEPIILSEVSQTEKDKYHMIFLICRI